MNGQLRDHPLAELICEISAERLSGALRLVRERVRAVIHFDAGQLVSARTNLRLHRLDESLTRWEALRPERLEALSAKGMSDEQVGELLVTSRLVTKDELQKFQVRQTEDVLRLLLLWTDGQWLFDSQARLEGQERPGINASQLLLEAARHLPPEFIASRLEDEAQTLAPSGKSLDDMTLQPEEAFVLSRVEGPIRAGELLAISGLPTERTRQAIYALSLSGFLRRASGARLFTAEALQQTRTARPSQPARPAQSEAAPRGDEDAGETATVKTAQEEADPQAELDNLFLRANGATYYAVLGIAHTAKPEEVKRAYYALAKRSHPDRFRQTADDSLRPRIEFAFGKLTQAYDVLKDSALRAAYDLKLKQEQQAAASQQQPKSFAAAAPERGEESDNKKDAGNTPSGSSLQYRAEECFQHGLVALQHKNSAMAAKYLGEAALLMPKQARYRAFYGRALAFDRQTRRQAESELQAAITLDEQNVSYRVMLAELYQEIGLKRRAEGELERALSIDPRHAQALRLRDALRNTT